MDDLILLEELLAGAGLMDALDAEDAGRIDRQEYLAALARSTAADAMAAIAESDDPWYWLL